MATPKSVKATVQNLNDYADAQTDKLIAKIEEKLVVTPKTISHNKREINVNPWSVAGRLDESTLQKLASLAH